jgi:N-acetylglucosamine transport system permease protein
MTTTTDRPAGERATSARPAPAVRRRHGLASGRADGILDVFNHAFLILWGLLTALPLLWAALSSFKDDREILSDPWGLPSRLRFDNWVRAWEHAHIGQYTLNSVIVVSGALALTMLLGAMAAYVLARYDFFGNRIVYFLFVGGMMFPVTLVIVPLFLVVRKAELLNTLHGLILVYAAFSLPFTVFFLTAFFRTLPTSVAEAALIDGCGHFRLFFRVMLPMARPGLISVGIFNFLWQWNQYILPVVLMQGQGSENKWVLAQGLAALAVSEGYAGDYSRLFAGLTIAMLPVLVVYVVFQRQVQAGLTAGHLK